MKVLSIISMLLLISISTPASANCAPWLDEKVGKLHSKKTLDLCALTKDRPVLIVNTASHCGFTPQFKQLQALYDRYKDQGLQIIGFPSNSFRQAASSEEKAADICYVNYGVKFAMTETVEVRGANAHPVFKSLAEQQGEPNWNFNKYLVSKDGKVVSKFGSGTNPNSAELTNKIDALL